MRSHLCIFCIGSNHDYDRHVPYVRNRIMEHFDSVVFSNEMLTEPVGMSNPSMFLNQVGRFRSSLSADDIRLFFKELERVCGREMEDKKREIIKMDIDLIKYDDMLLKPNDMEYEHVKRGIEELEIQKS